MKNFVKAGLLLLMLAVFLAPGSAFAKKVDASVYTLGVDNFVNSLNQYCNRVGIKLSGKKYTTNQYGSKICNLNFGNSTKNEIMLYLGSNGAIDSVWLYFPMENNSKQGDMPSVNQGLVAAACTLCALGLNEKEYKQFATKFENDIKSAAKSNKAYFDKTYKVYCSATKRTLTVETDIDDTEVSIDIEAYM